MGIIEIAKKLEQVEFFSGFPKDVLNYLANNMTFYKASQGEVLSKEGDYDPRLFLVDSGHINISKMGRAKQPVSIRTLSPGDVMGLTSVFESDCIRSATLTATEESTVWILDYSVFQDLISGNTDYNPKIITNSILAFLARKVRSKNYHIVDILSEEVDDRLHIAVFDSKDYFVEQFKEYNKDNYAISFYTSRLSSTTVNLAAGNQVVCVFVNDILDREVICKLKKQGTELIALMCAGYNNVDLEACKEFGISVVRVPAYSPNAVAEHAVALLMAINRKVHRAYNRVKEGNFSLSGLVGFDLYKKTVGVVGTGKIGQAFIRIMLGFGCKVVAYDKFENDVFKDNPNFSYVELEELFKQSDVISLHVPLLKDTHHLINNESISLMKDGVVLLNTSRGELIDTKTLITGLKSKKIKGAGLDVYEDEREYFFEDHSSNIINDDVFARIMSFNNVIITGHQGFLTDEALSNITQTTFENIESFVQGNRGDALSNSIV